MKLSIVIPVFNKFNFTRSALKDLSSLPLDHEIIIVDNASSDETQSELEKDTRIVYWRNAQNLGFAKACNIGYALATAPNVLFLNNDIRVKEDSTNWTQSLLDHCESAIVGPTMGQLDSQLNFVQEANQELTGNSYLSGWCMMASKNIWWKLDISGNNEIFSEEFFCYFEDTDLSFRARELGIPFKVIDIPVVHFGKVSSKQLNVGILYQNARNIFIKKWARRIKK